VTRPAERQTTVSGGALVAGGMVLMNVLAYGFTVLGAWLLVPREFGALTALLGIVLVGSVASLGLQATAARRLAVTPEHRDEIVAAVARVTLLVGVSMALLVALSSLVLTPLLRLDDYRLVVVCGLTMVPLAFMGAEMGIAQGTRSWRTLTAIYLANGVGRVGGGGLGLLVSPTPLGAICGVLVGQAVPALVGLPLLRAHGRGAWVSRRVLLREAILGTQALAAYFALSNLDSLIARNRFDEHEAGLYASGLILAKAAVFFPQFVSVVVFADLAEGGGRRARLRAVGMVAGLGTLATAATALLPGLALVLVGGDQYAEIQDRLWLFALAGSVLAVVHLLLFDALARHAHGVTVMVWAAVGVLVVGAYALDVHVTGLVTLVAATAAVLAVALWGASRAHDRSLAR
jgi:O-antigen/teichoic acid export membrane protein